VNLTDPVRDNQLEFGFRLARPSEKHAFRGTTSLQGPKEFPRGGNFQTATPLEEMPYNGGVRVCLDGIVDRKAIRKSGAERIELAVQNGAVVNVKGSSVGFHELRDGDAADHERFSRSGEMSCNQR
jgi:hypothetical protein